MEVIMAFVCGIVSGMILMAVVKSLDYSVSAELPKIPEKQLEKTDPADWWKNGGKAPWDEDDE